MIKNDKFKNFSKLFMGSILGQVFALLLYPYIARAYDPSDFARFGFIFSLTTVLSVFATGQLHTALMNPKEDEEARGLIGISCFVTLIFSLLTLVFVSVFDLTLIALPFYIFFYSMFEIQRMILIRHKDYSASATTQLTFRILGNGGKLLPIMISMQSSGLVFSEMFALMLVTGIGFYKKLYNFKFQSGIFKKYIHFPTFQSCMMALNLLIADYPIIFWSKYFSKTDIGYFVMGQRLLIVPALVASQALQNATVHHFIQSEKPLKHYISTTGLMVAIGTFGIAFFYLFGADLIGMLLGPTWKEGAFVFQLISCLLITKLIYGIVQSAFILKHETKIPFFIRIIEFGILFLVIKPEEGFQSALKSYLIIDISVEIILAIWIGFLLRPPFVFREKL